MSKTIFSPKQSALRDLYANLMLEVRHRIDLVSSLVQGSYGLPKLAAYELCYLQFRMICELIALSALAAHGDIPATRSGKMREAYKADWILNEMEKLHPDFYPKPGRQVRGADGQVLEVVPITSGFMSKRDLLKLYHESGSLLHRGAMKDLSDRKAGNFWRIGHVAQSIVTLLNHHQIALSDPQYQLWVIMKAESDNKVHATVMQGVSRGLLDGQPPRVN